MISTRQFRHWRIAAAVAGSLLLAACGKSALYSELSEQQANQVMAALMANDIAANKTQSLSKKGFEVDIAESDFPAAMEIMRANGLPGRATVSMDDLFKKDSFASSAQQEKALYTYGLQEGLRQKLLKVPGVVDAEVLIALPDREPLSGESPESSASVLIFQDPGVNLSDRETDLKVYIKDGIAGLSDVNKVTIKFFPASARQAITPKVSMRNGGTMPAALSAISPLAIGIAVGAAILLGLLFALVGRLRKPVPPRPAPPSWNG